MIGVSLAALVLAGCGGSPQGSSPETQHGVSQSDNTPHTLRASVTAPPVLANSSPGDVVAAFYEALRRGDNATIASLLTDKAKAETARSGLSIQSQASKGLQYEIRETEFVTEQMDGAHVGSVWSEPGSDGQLTSTEVVWILRREQGCWRISGMATSLAEGELPLVFNFEDPEDMQQKRSYAEAHLSDAQSGAQEAAAPVGQAALTQADPVGGSVERR
jgi:hypothetical protein